MYIYIHTYIPTHIHTYTEREKGERWRDIMPEPLVIKRPSPSFQVAGLEKQNMPETLVCERP